jgi:putative flippase GtrA
MCHDSCVEPSVQQAGNFILMKAQVVRFLMTGGLSTGLHYFVLGVLTAYFSVSAVVASSLGYFSGALLSYVLNYFFTFESERPHVEAVPRFYTMVFIGFVINASCVGLAADYFGWNKWVVQVIATCLTLIWNFWASRHWVFR